MQVAKAVLKEAVSGSKFAVEAVEQSDVAHITFQKVSLQANHNDFVQIQSNLSMQLALLQLTSFYFCCVIKFDTSAHLFIHFCSCNMQYDLGP